MSTSPDFVTYLIDQLHGTGAIRSKKMFGEYMLYVNEKPIFLICDDTVFVKILPETTEIFRDFEREPLRSPPYNGAKERYILDPDDAELLRAAARILEPLTPLPKKKIKKQE